MRHLRPLTLLATVSLFAAASVQAASPADGKKAAECFAIYKMAADSPANSAHKADLAKMQNLMGYAMDRNGVTQKQFTGYADALMTQLGKTPRNKLPGVMSAKRDACSAFAKVQYDALMKEKAASAQAPAAPAK